MEKGGIVMKVLDQITSTRNHVHDYWAHPPDKCNHPESYLTGRENSALLLSKLEPHLDKGSRILELGCNVGRNLNHLHEAGYHNLVGVELNQDAVTLMGKAYPTMAADATIHVGTIENILPSFDDRSFDAVFTVAVLEHIHWRSARVIRDIPRVVRKVLVTIEDERSRGRRHFPRDYGRIFRKRGLKQESVEWCDTIKTLGPTFCCRVFTRSMG